ncbi:oligoribonuclease [Nakamurella aerolata]|uniref:Oligoribonuclease n=1 Tax=Nakamurella aerolata TaxID=1656892 RepID=A0A849ABX9_9ACTN|nr:oligoribonuclease [Nakamurella aerolata]
MNDTLVWIDCEMTGLDLGSDALIEIAALVTDGNLNILGEGVDLVIHADDDKLANMPEVVRKMHAASGLTEQVRASTVTMRQAEQAVLEYVKTYAPQAKSALLAGNSIATDRGFIARDMPTLSDHLHYRMIDVSTVKELCRRWFPAIYENQPPKGMAHRALADIKESIAELAYYRAAAFVPEPGPTAEQAKAIAAGVVAAAQADSAATADAGADPRG